MDVIYTTYADALVAFNKALNRNDVSAAKEARAAMDALPRAWKARGGFASRAGQRQTAEMRANEGRRRR